MYGSDYTWEIKFPVTRHVFFRFSICPENYLCFYQGVFLQLHKEWEAMSTTQMYWTVQNTLCM